MVTWKGTRTRFESLGAIYSFFCYFQVTLVMWQHLWLKSRSLFQPLVLGKNVVERRTVLLCAFQTKEGRRRRKKIAWVCCILSTCFDDDDDTTLLLLYVLCVCMCVCGFTQLLPKVLEMTHNKHSLQMQHANWKKGKKINHAWHLGEFNC